MAQSNLPHTSSDEIPGTYPPEWLPDQDANSCIACDAIFTLIRRRHHCRLCGKIFCSDCCRQRAKLLYLGNKEGRVCNNCYYILETAHLSTDGDTSSIQDPLPESLLDESNSSASTPNQTRVQGVLKTTEQSNSNNSVMSPDNQNIKQVMFSDGIRPGTDLSESYGFPVMPSSSSNSSNNIATMLTRQNRNVNSQTTTTSGKKSQTSKSNNLINVCDDIGYLPPIVPDKSSVSLKAADIISVQVHKTSRQNDESESVKISTLASTDNNLIKFEVITSLMERDDGIITFLLLKEFYLRVKLVKIVKDNEGNQYNKAEDILESDTSTIVKQDHEEFWCFASDGLARLGQSEIVLILDKDKSVSSMSRDVFKIFLTIHELALRRQSLENLGNLLFQDGLFGNRDTAGLLLVRHMECQDISNYVLPDKPFLFALVLQRWEVPWSKVFPVRLLLRLGHKLGHYPYPLVSYRVRAPVYYEVGHTIISILGDFRNFRYSITHVEGLKVIIMKSERRILVQLNQSCYQQFTKVLDSSSNQHVLAWSAYPFDEADGHLVSVQNDDGNYETVEFYKRISDNMISFESLEMGNILGASFVIFSGALKANQSGRAAKISIVEDGLLIQLQSCTMSALKQSIKSMNRFDIDCAIKNLEYKDNDEDTLNKVNICWLPLDE